MVNPMEKESKFIKITNTEGSSAKVLNMEKALYKSNQKESSTRANGKITSITDKAS